MKQINTYITEKLHLKKDKDYKLLPKYDPRSELTIGEVYDFLSVPAQWGATSINYIIEHFDKSFFDKYPCTDAELNHNIQPGVTWKESIRKHNKLAKILELWPCSIIPKSKRFSDKQKPLTDINNLPGLIDTSDFEVIVYGGDIRGEEKKCITIMLESNKHKCQRAWFLFKEKKIQNSL